MTGLRGAYYRLPDALQRAVLVRRRQRIWSQAGIVFIHIPKAAGTSISEAIYGRFMGHVRALDVERWASPAVRSLPSFAVVRNPWDRVVSSFRFAKRLRHEDWKDSPGVPGVVRAQIPPIDSFEDFVGKWLVRQDLERLNPIFQPQHLFVCDGDKVLVDHLGHIENLGPTRAFIEAHSGRAAAISQSNMSGARVDYREFYTPALAKTVADLYRRDIDLFGYRF